MTASITPAMAAALANPEQSSTLLIRLGTLETIAAWPDDLTWDGTTWAGNSRIASVGAIRVQPGSLTKELRLTLGVADPTRLAGLANDIRGETFELYFAMVTSAGAVVIDPLMMMYGIMSPGTIADRMMTVIVKSRFSSRDGRAVPTYSEAWQRKVDSTDRCCVDLSNRTMAPLNRWNWVQRGGLAS